MTEALDRAYDRFRQDVILAHERKVARCQLPMLVSEIPPHLRHNGQKRAIHQLSPEISDRLGATHLLLARPDAPPESLEPYLSADRLSMEDAKPFRVAMAWRIVRTLARLKGLVADEELLVEALPFEPSPWIEAQTGYGALPPEQKTVVFREMRIEPAVRQICAMAIELPLLPPLPPKETPFDIERYTTDSDEKLLSYVDMIARMCAHYGYNSHVDGVYGMAGLLEPDLIRLVFPSPGEIMSYENVLALKIADMLGYHPMRDIRRSLAEVYHLTEGEINVALKIGVGQLHKQHSQDVEDARAMMIARTEDFISRSKESLDLTNEAKGLKILTLVQGLVRTEPEDANKDFEQMVDKVAGEQPTISRPEITVIDVPNLSREN